MDLCAFGFEAEVAFAHRGLADAVDELAVNRQLHRAIHADDIVGVPFAFAFAAELPGHAAASAWIVGNALETIGTEKFA